MSRRGLFLAGTLLVLLGGCATAPTGPEGLAAYKANNDPWEPLNRKVFAFNQAFDRVLLKPVAVGYVRLVPKAGRDSLRNFVLNLHEPVVFGNKVLQGRFGQAGTTAGRFLLDSTFGVAGLIDVAGRMGLPRQKADMGQTFFVWGVSDGPYLILPLFGPSNPRDAVGMGLESYLDPYRWVAANNNFTPAVAYAPAIIGGVDERSRNIDSLNAIQKETIDYYASFRGLYRQFRAAQLRGDDASAPPQQEGLYDDPDSTAPQKPQPDGGSLSH
jgi:phospholipid-binding lipoprotein MlaA